MNISPTRDSCQGGAKTSIQSCVLLSAVASENHLNPSTCVIASEEIVEEVHNPIPHGAMTDQHQEVLGVFSGICQDQRDSDQIRKDQQHTLAPQDSASNFVGPLMALHGHSVWLNEGEKP